MGFFHRHFSFGVSLLVAYYPMLRTGEVLHLKNSHIYMAGPKQPAAISLGMSRGGRRMGAPENATLCTGDALKWLREWKTSHSARASLCPATSTQRRCRTLAFASRKPRFIDDGRPLAGSKILKPPNLH